MTLKVTNLGAGYSLSRLRPHRFSEDSVNNLIPYIQSLSFEISSVVCLPNLTLTVLLYFGGKF